MSCLFWAYSNTRTQAHSQAVVLLVVVLQVRRILLSSNTSSKANYGLCAETGNIAAAMTNFSFTKSTELLTAVIFGRFAAVWPYFRTFLKSPFTARTTAWASHWWTFLKSSHLLCNCMRCFSQLCNIICCVIKMHVKCFTQLCYNICCVVQ